jgi:F1F0 ATPase subunit 2
MYIVGYLIGLMLGLVFFGGLYLSVRRLAVHKHPAAYMLIGTAARMAILLGGFYLLRGQGPAVMLFALLGVMSVRFFMVRWQKKELASKNTEEAGHEH